MTDETASAPVLPEAVEGEIFYLEQAVDARLNGMDRASQFYTDALDRLRTAIAAAIDTARRERERAGMERAAQVLNEAALLYRRAGNFAAEQNAISLAIKVRSLATQEKGE